ncbi:MAG: hypothetical protein FJ104_12955, partial [Deltaproteobacteria bacterium]|nr:hypothetical protein [Deltaproteobacteria bacterium]
PGGHLFLHEINTENPLFRFYMGYVFPLLRRIDDGTEEWILPGALPAVAGGAWAPGAVHFTFLPEFLPAAVFRAFAGLERWLERSRLRRYSAHFMATLVKSTDEAGE